jgi:hypothetical protein
METGKRGRNVHESLRLIGTPCNGPFKRPFSANSVSSLRASSLASLKNTTARHTVVSQSKVGVHTLMRPR